MLCMIIYFCDLFWNDVSFLLINLCGIVEDRWGVFHERANNAAVKVFLIVTPRTLSDETRSKLIPSRTTGVKSGGDPLKHTWSSNRRWLDCDGRITSKIGRSSTHFHTKNDSSGNLKSWIISPKALGTGGTSESFQVVGTLHLGYRRMLSGPSLVSHQDRQHERS